MPKGFAKGGKVTGAKSYAKAYEGGGFIEGFASGMASGYGEGSKKKKAVDPNLTTVEAPTTWEKLKGKFSSLGSDTTTPTSEKKDGEA